jgi:CYTH domain-containing protein
MSRYARMEVERRYLATYPPAAGKGWEIDDRYINDSSLRLRRMRPMHGGPTLYKLGQKKQLPRGRYAVAMVTSVYLTAAEYELLGRLPAHSLQKRRYQVFAGRRYTVDVFAGRLFGLVLAESEYESLKEAEADILPPPWASREVSADGRFRGAALAALSPAGAADFLAQIAPYLDPCPEHGG